MFYINFCRENSLRETFGHNAEGRRTCSKKFIEAIKPARPCLFVLEKISNLTSREALNYQIIWLKILLEKGFTSFNNQEIIDCTKQLNHKNKQLYDKRKNTNLALITACERCMIPTYKKQTCSFYTGDANQKQLPCPVKKTKLIQINVTEEEYQQIAEAAKKAKMQVAPYLRMVGQNPTIIQYDYSIIEKHTKEIGAVRSDINRLIFTIHATNNYLPKDIKSIVEMINDIFESENKLLKTLREQRMQQYEQHRALIKKETKKQQGETQS